MACERLTPHPPISVSIFAQVWINPQIAWLSEDFNWAWEGCQSMPGMRGWIKRPRAIVLKGYGEDGEQKERQFEASKKSLFRLLLNVAHPLLPYLKKSFRQEEEKTHTRRKHTKSPPVFKPRTRVFSPYVTHKKPAPLFSNTAPLLSLHV